jgi:L-iditol 2-dehydrogenase
MNLVLRLHGAGELRLHEEPAPMPDPHEALIRVRAVGLCGSDLHWFSEGGIGDALISKPLVLGHELAGEILTGERQGEHVAIDPAIPCGQCRSCRHGHPNLCPSVKFAGHGEQDGGLREQMAWPEEHLFALPDSISAAEGAMLEPLGVALHAVNLAKVQIGMRAGVFGCGPIGLLVIQLLRVMGAAQIVATEVLPHRLEAARDDETVHYNCPDKYATVVLLRWVLFPHHDLDKKRISKRLSPRTVGLPGAAVGTRLLRSGEDDTEHRLGAAAGGV